MAFLQVNDLSFTYPNQTKPALDGLTFSVERGQFVLLCGSSGSGKSTLLRQLKPTLRPHGAQSGQLLFDAAPLDTLSLRTQTERIALVLQSPENQVVTDTVWRELAFGLERLGCEADTIRLRVAEMAGFFGITHWLERETSTLSGGQLQILNLAAVMTLSPALLLLDEPTAMLDPVAATDFLTLLRRINQELGITIFLSEHRLEELLPLADHVIFLEGARLLCQGSPAQVGHTLLAQNHPLAQALPAAMQLWSACDGQGDCPLTVRGGQRWLDHFAQTHPLSPPPAEPHPPKRAAVLTAEKLYFGYELRQPLLKNLSIELEQGELFALLGANGAGKSTLLKLLAGLDKPQRGSVRTTAKLGLLPQSPQTLFLKKTLGEDLTDSLRLAPPDEKTPQDLLAQAIALCRLDGLLERHPFDLSAGEQQRAALAKLLLWSPQVLLLDEPTKGLDAVFKAELAAILAALQRQGVSILMASHDVEFCARCADRCALLFDGALVSQGTPRSFFPQNRFYTTAANRIAWAHLPELVTLDELLCACGAEPAPPNAPPIQPPRPAPEPPSAPPLSPATPPTAVRRRSLSRSHFAALIVLLLVPLTVLAGRFLLDDNYYFAISMLIVLELLLPFFLLFEGRRPQARELAVHAVLCALGVAGRAITPFFSQFKPVAALSILAGVGLGPASGFLVGAVSMLLSNMLLVQGPWTPWQMFAMGLVGFLGGLLFQNRKNKWLLPVYGFVATFALYGTIMNLFSALSWHRTLTPSLVLAYMAAGLPADLTHGLSTALLLLFLAPAMSEILKRIRDKYGM